MLVAHLCLQGVPEPSALPFPTYPDLPRHLRPTPTRPLGHRCRPLAGVLQASRHAHRSQTHENIELAVKHTRISNFHAQA